MQLYHFTCLFHLPSILAIGLNRGDIILSFLRSLNAPSFTTNPNRDAVHWAVGSKLDKRKVRILVDLRDDDKNLVPWRQLMKQRHVDREIVRAVDKYGQGKFWWVYLGTVTPGHFVSIEVFDGKDYVAQDSDKLRSLVANIEAELEKFSVRNEGGITIMENGGEDSWLFDGEAPVPVGEDDLADLANVERENAAENRSTFFAD